MGCSFAPESFRIRQPQSQAVPENTRTGRPVPAFFSLPDPYGRHFVLEPGRAAGHAVFYDRTVHPQKKGKRMVPARLHRYRSSLRAVLSVPSGMRSFRPCAVFKMDEPGLAAVHDRADDSLSASCARRRRRSGAHRADAVYMDRAERLDSQAGTDRASSVSCPAADRVFLEDRSGQPVPVFLLENAVCLLVRRKTARLVLSVFRTAAGRKFPGLRHPSRSAVQGGILRGDRRSACHASIQEDRSVFFYEPGRFIRFHLLRSVFSCVHARYRAGRLHADRGAVQKKRRHDRRRPEPVPGQCGTDHRSVPALAPYRRADRFDRHP